MVFFNYSTMQMAAKIVYYGPGLCGKTTNLQQIYNQTSSNSRGEMVSLETETDRTLFFDLLPIDVGTIGGFATRIQLYTVPGQVFYNTTRKLVLKGVDGVVFVADSQKPMLQANVDSLRNLQENLTEMGIDIEAIPLVLQFNKRDLPSICTAEEMNQALNWQEWPFFEASAIHAQGVFETLKGISKLTLVALKRRLARNTEDSADSAAPAASTSRSPASPPPVAPARPAPPGTAHRGTAQQRAAPSGAAPSGAAPPGAAPSDSPPLHSRTESPAPAPKAALPQAPAERSHSGRKDLDILGELEKLRREVQRTKPLTRPQKNGHSEMRREIKLSVDRNDFARLRRFSLNLQVEDENQKVVNSIRDFTVDIQDPGSLEKVLLTLSIALSSKG